MLQWKIEWKIHHSCNSYLISITLSFPAHMYSCCCCCCFFFFRRIALCCLYNRKTLNDGLKITLFGKVLPLPLENEIDIFTPPFINILYDQSQLTNVTWVLQPITQSGTVEFSPHPFSDRLTKRRVSSAPNFKSCSVVSPPPPPPTCKNVPPSL